MLTWSRWKRRVIDDQIRTARGAERYVKSGKPIFLDPKCEVPFPIPVRADAKIHTFIVAHGARDACKAIGNVYGSLAIAYGELIGRPSLPFSVTLPRSDIVHVLDCHNLEIVFGELDTFPDLVAFIEEKERIIQRYGLLSYCGEEDLLAHYLANFDQESQSYRIGVNENSVDCIAICEGDWREFVASGLQQRRRQANQISYLWDEIIQRTAQNRFDGTLLGELDLLHGNDAIHEMAKDPRVYRRALAEEIARRIKSFPEDDQSFARTLSLLPSFYCDKAYVFLQVKRDPALGNDNKHREFRQALLVIACGVAKNKLPHLNKTIGLSIDAPKYSNWNFEDFVCFECSGWTKEQQEYFRRANEYWRFFHKIRATKRSIQDFPPPRQG